MFPFIGFWSVLNRYRRVFSNWINVLISIYNNKYPIICILRGYDGKLKILAKSFLDIYLISRFKIKYINDKEVILYYNRNEIKILGVKKVEDMLVLDGDMLIFKNYNGREVKFGFGWRMGEIFKVFIDEDYKFLDVDGKTVIDIGANIADSSIYFAVNGAQKVIALEPYPYVYNLALSNIKLNNLEDIIILLNEGYGKDHVAIVNENKITDVGSDFVESRSGKEIKLSSLRTLLQRFNLSSIYLKMDCEGCEYNLLNEDDETLHKIEKLQIEYHYGYRKLVERLGKAGFKLKYTTPSYLYNNSASNPHMYLGYIYGERT